MPQSLSRVLVHLVFSTRHRTPWLTPDVREELYPYLGGVLDKLRCTAIRNGGVADHVHLLFGLSRTVAIAEVVEKLKSSSSKWVKAKTAKCGEFAWQSGYGVLSVSESHAEACIRYIEAQEEHHKKLTFQDEYRELMRLAGIEVDERYVWD